MSNPTRPAMPIKSRLPDDLDKAYSHALDYAIELEQVWAPKVLAYMDHCEATIKRLRDALILAREWMNQLPAVPSPLAAKMVIDAALTEDT